MDFVTITDHDTIDGVLAIADRPDVFVSEELTARFARRAAGRAHPLLRHHARRPRVAAGARRRRRGGRRVPARARDRLRARAPVLRRRGAADAAPPPPARRAVLDVWEVRNGARAPELNAPPAIYVDTHGGIGVGGSDDHAGVDIGRTWTETPRGAHAAASSSTTCAPAASSAHGEQGSAAKWAHAAMAIAVRALGRGECDAARTPRPSCGWSSGSCPRATPARARSAATSAPTTPARCCARGSPRSTSTCRRASCSRCCSPTTSATPS